MELAPSFLHPSFGRHNSSTPPGLDPPQHVVHCLPGQVQLLGDQRHLLPLGFPLEDHACHSGRDLVGDAPRPAALVHRRRHTTGLDDRLDPRRLRCFPGGDPFGPYLGLVSRHGGKDVRNQPARRGAEVHAVLERDEVHLEGHQFVEEGGQALGGAAQPVQPPDNDALDLPSPDVGQEAGHGGAVQRLAGEGVGVPGHGLAAGAGLDGAIGAAVAVGLKSAPFSPDPLSVLRSSFRFAL